MSADRNLLAGILALEKNFISRESLLQAMQAWVQERHRPLAELLPLSAEQRPLLDAAVEEHLDPFPGSTEPSTVDALHSAAESTGEYDAGGGTAVHRGPTLLAMKVAIKAKAKDGCRFRIIRPHARGGLGEVYLAEDTELRREVALKEIREQRAEDQDSRGRFVMEAEVTGGLEHPNIVPVYGMGIYGDGRPYYAMRLIRGESLSKAIDRYYLALGSPGGVAAANLAFRDLLKRFVDVCNAVAYAHSRGIIHRDLKPDNIMLGKYGETLVVDWGLAKSLASGGCQPPSSDLGENTLQPASGSGYALTLDGHAVGTPVFMSPEQAAGKLDELGPAADVYSLGATLYVLLTGKSPFQGEVATVLQKVEAGDFAPPIQVQPHTPPALNAVVLKAMAKDAKDRYATATELGQEIERILADEPVAAYREPFAARAKRWARKHPGTVAGLAAALIVGTIGLGTGLYFVNEEKNEKELARKNEVERAEGERTAKRDANEKAELALKRLRNVEKANEIMGSIFENLDPKEIARNERPLQATLVEELDKAVVLLDKEAIGDDNVVAAMQNKLGMSLLGLGAPTKAIPLFLRCRAIRIATLGLDHPDTLSSMNNLACSYDLNGQINLAVPLYEETYRLRKDKLGDAHPDTLISMNNLALGYSSLGKYELALPLYEKVLKLRETILGPEHIQTLRSMDNLASGYQSVRRFDLAIPLNESALKLMKTKLGPDHPDTVASMNILATSYDLSGKYELAMPLYIETYNLRKVKLGPDHPSTLTSMNNLASYYHTVGNLDLAIPLYEEALMRMKNKLGSDHPKTLTTMNNLARCYESNKKFELALPLFEETIKLRKSKLGPNHVDTLKSMYSLAHGYKSAAKLELALKLYEETLALMKVNLGMENSDTLLCMNNIASCYYSMGKYDLAVLSYEETLKFRKALLGPNHPDTLMSMNNLAAGYFSVGKVCLALPLYENAACGMEKHRFQHEYAFTIIPNAIATYELAKQYQQAESWRRKWLLVVKDRAGGQTASYATELAALGLNLFQQSKWAEAEVICRECLVIRMKVAPDAWNTYNVESMVGDALLRQKKYGEAESELVFGYEGMKSREKQIPPGSNRLREAAQRLVDFYTATNQPAKAKEWQAKLPKEIAPPPRRSTP